MVACHFNFQFQVLAFFKEQRNWVWFILLWMQPILQKFYHILVITKDIVWSSFIAQFYQQGSNHITSLTPSAKGFVFRFNCKQHYHWL
jgi:hypothetical protein